MPDYNALAYKKRARDIARLQFQTMLNLHARFMRSIGPWSDAEMAAYQDRVEGVRTRLADLVRRKPKLIRSVRNWSSSYGLGGER